MPSMIGQNWLLLRGLSREAAHWGDFLALLQTSFPTARISTLDLPGTGLRFRETSPSNIREITESVRILALQRGLLNQPLTVVALSLGGMVCWEWMLNYPADICGAALINTSLATLSPFYQRLRWQSYPNFFKIVLQPNRFHRELAVIKWVSNRRDRDENIALEWERIQAQRPVSLSNSFRQIMAAARYRPQEQRPKPPILLLGSRGDRLVAPACTNAIQKKWHLALDQHPWAGHDLTLDDGQWVADRLQTWVEQLKHESANII